MHGFIKNILTMTTAALLAGMATSCVYDDQPEEPETPQADPMLVINMQLPMMRAGAADNGKYEPGTGYENYIDITANGFRIYLFDTNNKFIVRFIPMLLAPSDGNTPDTYMALGKVPAELESLSDFKIVVLANWPTYSDSELTPGVSNIDDLCGAEWAQFNRLAEYELNPGKGLTIPFYGVHEYAGVTFTKGKRTTLTEPVAMLRAMAKVEVIFDNPGLSLSDVALHGFNSKGYCAPAGVYSQGQYDHNGQWSEDYVKTLHLPGNANDPGQANNVTHLYCKNHREGEQKETWVCYVPEYKNTDNADGTANHKSYLKLTLDIPDINLPNISFTDYDSNGQSVAGTDFDLHRNNCYRFNVSLKNGGLIIKVQKWENTYDNNYIFN